MEWNEEHLHMDWNVDILRWTGTMEWADDLRINWTDEICRWSEPGLEWNREMTIISTGMIKYADNRNMDQNEMGRWP